MRKVSAPSLTNKKVLLRYDIDVPIKDKKVVDDFRLKAGLDTLKLCLEHTQTVTILGHIGRPQDEDPNLSVEAVYDWFFDNGFSDVIKSKKLQFLENLRFESGEEECSMEYSKSLAEFGEIYINEAFASYHKASSTTVLPTLMPSFCGIHFNQEVEQLTQIREDPKKPLISIIGGAKIDDKLPAVLALSKISDKVLVGGRLPEEIINSGTQIPGNVYLAEMNPGGTDITEQTVKNWTKIINSAAQILWNGPMGKFEESGNNQTRNLAHVVIDSGAQTIIGGGDTISALKSYGLLNKISFVSTGGGAMLELLINGTLPTIEALE
jgi:phosphoglycerate kinase